MDEIAYTMYDFILLFHKQHMQERICLENKVDMISSK
jgi:hypothetical protein